MNFVIAAGGTGGHLFPGLALAEEVKTRHPRNDVLFVGTQRGLEMRVVPKAGFPLETIDVGPLKRQGGLGLLRGLGRVPRSLWRNPVMLIVEVGAAFTTVLLPSCRWISTLA